MQLPDFPQLPIFQKIQLLGELNLAYCSGTPLIICYYMDLLRQYRRKIRTPQLPSFLENTSSNAEIREFYYGFRNCTTWRCVSLKIWEIQKNDLIGVSQKELCLLTEYLEDLLEDCLKSVPWTEEIQEEACKLVPTLEKHQLLNFAQCSVNHIREIGIDRFGQLVTSMTQMLEMNFPESK